MREISFKVPDEMCDYVNLLHYHSSLTRKESYKRMQDQQERDASVYAPSSNATLVSRRSRKNETYLDQTFSDKAIGAFNDLLRQIRNGEWTPRLVLILCLILLLTFLLMFVLWSIFSWLFLTKSDYTFYLYPPTCEECIKRNPNLALSYRSPSKLYVRIYSPAQVHFELVGSLPFRSNSFTAIDFDNGYVAIADHALTNERGRHFACFLMELDRSALPDMSALAYALKNTYSEVRTQFGWQEYWQYTVEPVDASFALTKFKDEVRDCQGAKWYFLKQSVYTKDSSCSDCYDFCLPDYAVLRRQKYEDDVSIGIRRLNCFRLYIPEWYRFQLQTDSSGGHWQYPQRQPQYTQRDNDGNWLNWIGSTSQQEISQKRRETSNPKFINLTLSN